MKRMFGIGIAMATIIGVAMAPGCGDDGGEALSIEDYFERLDELENEADEASDDLESEVEEIFSGAEDFDDIRDDFKDFIGDQRGILSDFLDGVRDLDPPEDVKDAHDDTVAAFEDFVDELDGVDDLVDDAESFEDISSDSIDAAETRLNEACDELQEIATDNDIDIELDCGGDD